MSIAIPVNGTPHAQAYHARRNTIDALLQTTCLVSPWLVIAGGTFASMAPWGPLGMTIMGGIFLGMILTLKEAYRAKLSREPSMDFSPYIENAPKALKKMVRDISHTLGMEKVPGIYTINSLEHRFSNGFALPSNIFISGSMYKKMTVGNRRYTAAHEIAHISKDNWNAFNAMRMADILSLSFAPGLLVTTFSGVASGNITTMSLAIFGTCGATLAASAAFLFNRFMHYQHRIISEFRADRLAVAATGDPIGAISFLDKFDGNDVGGLPTFFPEVSYHPPKRARILRIIEDFNKANPQHAITVYGRTWFHAERSSPRNADIVYFDATRFNGQCYKINPFGFYPIKPSEIPGNPPEIGAGQLVPNPV